MQDLKKKEKKCLKKEYFLSKQKSMQRLIEINFTCLHRKESLALFAMWWRNAE